jgi:hypothetical protein
VTRELNRLARIGLVTRNSDALVVSDIDRLAQMVQDATVAASHDPGVGPC